MEKIISWFKGKSSKNDKGSISRSPSPKNSTKVKKLSVFHLNKGERLTRTEALNDAPIIRSQHQTTDNSQEINTDTLNNAIKLSAVSKYTKIERKTTERKIPIMLTLAVDEIEISKQRAGLDLVLVIDVSSSMSGQKIQLVRETLLFIIDELEEIDRVSLVKFDSSSDIINSLIPATPANKEIIKALIVNEIIDNGSTNIKDGLASAFEVLVSRKEVNDITSIFFLSDGDDTCGNTKADIVAALKQYDEIMNGKGMDYKINSFGYGDDHDEEVLCEISNFKDGKFFYIKNTQLVDECFIECLGNLISVFATSARIDVHLCANVSFAEKHGHLWNEQTDTKTGYLKVGSLYGGMMKNYLADVSITDMPDDMAQLVVLSANLSYVIQNKEFCKKVELVIDIVSDGDLGQANTVVEQNLVRVEAAKLVQFVEEQYDLGNSELAEEKVCSFKKRVKDNSDLHSSYVEKMDKILDTKNIRNKKYTKQAYEMMSNESYKPGCENIVERKGMSAKMYLKKKG